MCLLIVKKQGVERLPLVSHFQNAFLRNPDGIWVSFSRKFSNTVTTKKFLKFQDFINFHETAPYQNKTRLYSCIFHFRLATSWGVNKSLIHPFFISNNESIACEESTQSIPVLAHNGILSNIPLEMNKSDTLIFVSKIAPLFHFFSRKTGIIQNSVSYLISLAIGKHNKVSILFPGWNTIICNEESFHILDWIHYSNTSYVPYLPLSPSSPYPTYHNTHKTPTIAKNPYIQPLNREEQSTIPYFPPEYYLG